MGVVIFVMCFTVYMVYQLLSAYFEYKSFDKTSVEWQDDVTLPAITICNLNTFNYTRFKQEMASVNNSKIVQNFEEATKLIIKIREGSIAEENVTSWDAVQSLYDFELNEGNLALRFNDHIHDTLFGHFDYLFRGLGQSIPPENINQFSQFTELGLCFELNDDGIFKQSAEGVKGGLSFDLDVKGKDYIFSTPSKGFALFIRDQDETVMLDQGGYMISPGSEAFVVLKKNSVDRLGKPHGDCENKEGKFSKYGEHYQTVRECIQRQKLLEIMKKAHCIPWFLVMRLLKLNKTDVLDEYIEIIKQTIEGAEGRKKRNDQQNSFLRKMRRVKRGEEESNSSDTTPNQEQYQEHTKYSDITCGFLEYFDIEIHIENLVRKGHLTLDDCPEPCHYNSWMIETSSLTFPPTRAYFESFIKDSVNMAVPTFEYMRENMVRLHIYYDEIKVDKVTQTKAYEPQNFLAEFGGTVDLFIGFSFFTVFQLIEIAMAMCISKLSKMKKSERSNTQDDGSTMGGGPIEVIENPS